MLMMPIPALIAALVPALQPASANHDVAAPAVRPQAAQVDEAEREREARRVLRLANGQSIRVQSRWRDGAWEYRGQGGWKRLEPALVVGAEREQDLLREWRKRRDAADLREDAERVALAHWAADAGLATEALAELDRVLERAPDHAGALAIVSSAWLLSVPSLDVAPEAEAAAREELLRFGSNLPPAGREVALIELAKAKDRETLRKELARDLWSPIVVRRSFAALALRRIFPGDELRPLLVHSVRDASEDVRRASARALRGAEDPAIVVPIVKALGSSSLAIRANSAAALGEAGYLAAVPALISRMAAALQSGGEARPPHSHIFIGRQISYVQDFDVEVAQFQAVADPQINVLIEGNVLDAGVIGVREESVAIEVVAIRGALEKLTGLRPGGTARDWFAWWDREGQGWLAARQPATAGG
jgi:transcription elongation GreA/GreB family factor